MSNIDVETHENKIIANSTKYATFVSSGRARFRDLIIVYTHVLN